MRGGRGRDRRVIIRSDLPPEEDEELWPATQGRGINFMPPCTPTTDDKRLPKRADHTSGFLYYVSVTGNHRVPQRHKPPMSRPKSPRIQVAHRPARDRRFASAHQRQQRPSRASQDGACCRLCYRRKRSARRIRRGVLAFVKSSPTVAIAG